jgi:hypothetical protein
LFAHARKMAVHVKCLEVASVTVNDAEARGEEPPTAVT